MAEEQTNTQEQTAQEKEAVDLKNLVRCPCCGKFTLKRPLKPNQQFSDHWLACMTTGVQFNHTYPLYNGKLLITVTQLSAEVAINLDVACTALDILMDRAGSYIDSVDILQIRNMARLYVSIKDITVHGPGEHPQVFKPADAVDEALGLIRPIKQLLPDDTKRDEWLPVLAKACDILSDPANVSSVPVQLLISVTETHNRLNGIMLDLGLDENFWKGIELV